jgi:hypothetical protein
VARATTTDDFEELVMSMMLIALLAVVLPALQIGRAKAGWLNVIASGQEMHAVSSRELLERFKMEKVFWRQFEIGQAGDNRRSY